MYTIAQKTNNQFMILEGSITKSTISVDGDILSTNVSGNIGTVIVAKGKQKKIYTYNLETRNCIKLTSI